MKVDLATNKQKDSNLGGKKLDISSQSLKKEIDQLRSQIVQVESKSLQ